MTLDQRLTHSASALVSLPSAQACPARQGRRQCSEGKREQANCFARLNGLHTNANILQIVCELLASSRREGISTTLVTFFAECIVEVAGLQGTAQVSPP